MERCSQCEARGGLGSRFFDVKIWGIGVCIGTSGWCPYWKYPAQTNNWYDLLVLVYCLCVKHVLRRGFLFGLGENIRLPRS